MPAKAGIQKRLKSLDSRLRGNDAGRLLPTFYRFHAKENERRIDMLNQKMVLHFSESHQRNPGAMVDMILDAPKRFELSPDYVLKARLTSHSVTAKLAQAKNLLKEIAQRVNG